jgi:hypothetical protein
MADCILEEGQPDISFLPAPQAHLAFLFLHALLYHPPNDNVCA